MKKCEWCGREFEKQGALNLHKSVHCKNKPAEVRQEKKEKKSEKCEHDFRLLDLSRGIENIAHSKGYKEVCQSCQELR